MCAITEADVGGYRSLLVPSGWIVCDIELSVGEDEVELADSISDFSF